MTTRTDFEDKFAETGKNIDNMVEDTRMGYKEKHQLLKEKWEKLKVRHDSVNDKDDGAWEGIKDELEEGWKDVEDSYDDIKKNFGEHQDHTGHSH